MFVPARTHVAPAPHIGRLPRRDIFRLETSLAYAYRESHVIAFEG
jgi:hypothetical protein